MNKKTIVIGILLLAGVLVGTVLQFNSLDGRIVNYKEKSEELSGDEKQLKAITVGYCPTMGRYAKKISAENEAIKLEIFSSASVALNALELGLIDAVIIGRAAYPYEIGPRTKETRLRSGYTLVGNERALIDREELNNIEIHTYLTREKVQEQLSKDANIVTHESKDEAIETGLNKALLIPWEDYKPPYELIIPVNSDGSKVEEFRAPVVYHNKLEEGHINIIEKFKE